MNQWVLQTMYKPQIRIGEVKDHIRTNEIHTQLKTCLLKIPSKGCKPNW